MFRLFLFVGLLGLGAIVGLVGGLFKRRDQKKQRDALFSEDAPPPVIQSSATVSAKETVKLMTGSYHVPGHRVAYVVHFLLDTSEELPLEVPESDYDGLPIGRQGTLVMQNGGFVAFESGAP